MKKSFQPMKTLYRQRKHIAGFSLVELAIVILITTILMSAGLSLLTVKRNAAQLEATLKNQETIKQALINYLGQNKRLPCPGDINGAELTRIATAIGTTPPPCPSYSGIVPYKELGLDRATAIDGWENFITYVVSQNINPTPPSQQPVLPSLPAQQPAPAPVLTTAWLYTFNGTMVSSTLPYTKTTTFSPTNLWVNPSPPYPPQAIIPFDAAFWPSTSTGGITVTDGTVPIADPTKNTGAAVVLISYGKNGYGAFNVKGGQNSAPPAPSLYEQQNATNTVVTTSVIKHDTTDSTTSVGGPFDDIVMILSANDLIGPLIANGTLQSSPQAALIQANNIVLGNIVAQRGGCTPCSYPIPASFTFPASVTAWGVSYARFVTTINSTSTGSTPAYTLTAGDGTIKNVSIDELHGILAGAAGFI